MKKLLCLLSICSVLTTFASSAVLPLNTAAVESSSENEDVLNAEHSEALENAYTLLQQFIAEQKESGNEAFHGVMVIANFEKNRLFVLYDDEDIVPIAIKAFMQENGMGEIPVNYLGTLPLLGVVVTAYNQLQQFVKEQKESGNSAFYSVNVYDGFDYFNGNENGGILEEYQNKIILEYSVAYEETVLAAVKSFMQENDIDESFVIYFPLEGTPTVNPGDVNEDGNIDVSDVIIINKAILGKVKLTDAQLKAIDFNGNGKPDAEEALLLLKYIVDLVPDFTM